jgi:O-antigen/teichoic acid export membrane protein
MKPNFLLNFISLNTVSLIIKALNFLLFLFLVQTLSIRDYGVYVLVWSQVNLFTPLLDFGTTSYGLIYLNKDNKEHLYSLLSLRFIIALGIFIIVILSGFLYKQNVIPIYIFLTAFAVFGNALYGSHVILTSLEQKPVQSSVFSLLFSIVLIVTSIISLLLTKSLTVLFVVISVMYIFNTVVSWLLIRRIIPEFTLVFDLTIWKKIISSSYVFVLISFFLGIYFKIDVFLLNFLQSEKEVGIYSAGYKFFEAFLFLIASYNLSATPLLAKYFKENKVEFYKKIGSDVLLLMIFGILVAVCIFMISPMLLPLVIKNNVLQIVKVLQIVIFSLPCMLFATVFTNILYIYKKSYIIIFVFLVQIIINTALNLVFIPKYSYVASSYITLLSEILNACLIFLLFLYFKKNEDRS